MSDVEPLGIRAMSRHNVRRYQIVPVGTTFNEHRPGLSRWMAVVWCSYKPWRWFVRDDYLVRAWR